MHNGQSLSELELNEKLLVTNRIIIELEKRIYFFKGKFYLPIQ